MEKIYFVIVSTKDNVRTDGRICDTPEDAKSAYNEMFGKYPNEFIRIVEMDRNIFYANVFGGYKLGSYLNESTAVNPMAL